MTDVLTRYRKAVSEPHVIAVDWCALAKELAEECERLSAVLTEARLQIEYLHGKFQPTSSGIAVLSRIEAALNPH